ncbi:MAG: B12-binding domain-containing radical SAM protein [Calditrichaeota bacterium]|nr:B12-binding domain-containing radical SAM protein [Calditrichota bacterium]
MISQYKIIFIEPKAPNFHIFSKFVIPRLGTLILGTMMKQMNWDVRVIIEENEELSFELLETADLVGISTISSTATRAYIIADQVRALGIPVLMGGPHVTYLPDEALEHCDFVFRGEAEKALPVFIEQWLSEKNWEKVPNLSFRKGTDIVHNSMVDFVKNLDEIPYPDFSLIKNGIRKTYGYRIVPVQTSRGCPFDCEFCSVTGMFGRKYRFRSADNIIEELKRYNEKGNFVFFYDDNFAANHRRTRELLEKMIEQKFSFRWSTQVRADVAKDPELVHLMKKAGCETVFIGFESVDPVSLKEMKKKQTVEEIRLAIEVFRKNCIHIHGMFVFGFDSDTLDSIGETIKFVARSSIGTVQFLVLTPLPGTRTYSKLQEENRIKFSDWALYDAHHAVFEPKNMTMEQLQQAQMRGHQKFYSLKQLMKKLFRFKINEIVIGIYARRLNRNWKKKNHLWLKILELLKPNFDFKINIDVRQLIRLPEWRKRANNSVDETKEDRGLNSDLSGKKGLAGI